MNLEEQTRTFGKENPTYEGGSWGGHCGSAIFRFLQKYGIPPTISHETAQEMATDARPLNKNYSLAPAGSFHYWAYGQDGHVGLEVRGGGKLIFMASSNLTESLGKDIGFTTMENYKLGGLPYWGWSKTYGKNGKIKTEVNKPPEVIVQTKTEYEIERESAIIRMFKARIVLNPNVPLTKIDLCVILARFADALAKGTKI